MQSKKNIFHLVRSIFRILKPLLNRLHIRSAFLNVAESKDLRISYTTPVRTLKKFLLQFRPIETEHELERIGGNNDGGYLVPKSELSDIDACFSIGCNFMWDFEREIGEKYEIPSIIVDEISKKPDNLTQLQEYFPGWLGKTTNSQTISLEGLVRKSKYFKSDNLLLQMDIEGSEFECLLDTPKRVLRQFRLIVIEIHNVQNILHNHLFRKFFSPLMNLLREDFEVLHAHPNNACDVWRYNDIVFPEVIEMTFLRRDRIKLVKGYATLPHKLDESISQVNPPIDIEWEIFVNSKL